MTSSFRPPAASDRRGSRGCRRLPRHRRVEMRPAAGVDYAAADIANLMIRKVFRLGMIAGLAGLGAFSTARAAELRAVRLAADTNSAEMTLDLSGGAPQ